MKKIIIGLLWTSVAFAQDKLDYYGEFKLRNRHYENNQYGSDRREFLEMRLRLNFDYEVNNNLKLMVAPQVVRNLGEVEYRGDDATSNSAYQTSGDVSNSRVDLFEAYAEGKRESFTYKLGRQMLRYGENVVIGHRNWNMNGQSFDAFKLTKKIGEHGKIDGVYAKIVEGPDRSDLKDNENFSMLYYSWLKNKNQRDLYYIYKNNSEVVGDNDFSTFGARIKHNFENLTLTLEEIAQTNTFDDHVASSSNLTLQYKLQNNFELFGTYSFNSDRYDQLYTNRHIHNGFMDMVGRPNLERASVGLKAPLLGGRLRVELLDLRKANSDGASYGFNGESVLVGDDSEDHLGTELDVTYQVSISENEQVEFGYSAFEAGDFFQEQKLSQFGYIQYSLSFGN